MAPSSQAAPRLLPHMRPWMLWFGLAVTVGAAYLALRDVRYGDVWQALRETNYWWLLPALAVFAVSIGLRAIRWWLMFSRATRPPLRAVTSALLLGYFFNNVLPVRAGEAVRVIALRQRAGVSKAEVAVTVVTERVFDVIGLLAVLFVAVPWLPTVSWLHSALVLALVLVVCLAGFVVALAIAGDRLVRAVLRPLSVLPFLTDERIAVIVENMHRGLASFRNWRLGLAAAVLTTLSWLVMGISYWLVLRSFDLGLSPAAGLLVVVAIGLAMILPSSSAAVGVFEAATVVALKAYHVPKAEALSYALVLHAVNFVPFIVVGAAVLRMHAAGVRRTAGAETLAV